MKNLSINTIVNFGGFYGSIHSEVIDYNIELMGYDWQKVDYNSTFETYAKSYIKALNQKLDTNISFKALNSPKFYNYSTDNINVEISKKDVLKIFKYTKEEDLKQGIFDKIKNSSTSSDGYISLYSYEDYFKKDNLDLLFECIFDVIVDNLEDDIIEELQANYLEIILNYDN